MDSFANDNFIWLDEYKIVHDTVDTQHQYLFELANRIVDPYNDQQTTYLNVVALYDYTHKHISDEESLMKQYNYPDYALHEKAHKRLISELDDVRAGILNDETKRDDVIKFMRDWVLTHILDEDMRFGNFLRERELNATAPNAN